MQKMVLIGGGGHCKSVLSTLLRMNKYKEVVIVDNEIQSGNSVFGIRVVGNDSKLYELFDQGFTDAFVTVGSIKSSALRRKLFELALNIGYNFPMIIDPSAQVSRFAKIGEGVFIGKNVVVNADAIIEKMAIINTSVIVEHECFVGQFSHIAVGTVLCGNVYVGQDSFVGAGSTVIQGIVIGDNAVVGAGSTVLNDVPNGTVHYGIVK